MQRLDALGAVELLCDLYQMLSIEAGLRQIEMQEFSVASDELAQLFDQLLVFIRVATIDQVNVAEG